MAFKVFLVPAKHNEKELEELNDFIKTHRVVSVRWEWCASGEYWSVLVDYKESSEAQTAKYEARSSLPEVDYQEVLSAQEFQVFGKIKDWRNKEAKKLKIPAFTLFNNKQMAEMIQKRMNSQAALAEVIGDERAKSYSEILIKFLKVLPPLKEGQVAYFVSAHRKSVDFQRSTGIRLLRICSCYCMSKYARGGFSCYQNAALAITVNPYKIYGFLSN